MARYRIDFQGTIYGTETFQHGHHVDSADSAAGVATDAAAQWLTQLAVVGFSVNWRTDVVWSQVNVSELGATPGAPVVTSAQAAIADGGTGTGASLPAQCSPCISLRSATAGSRARGRMYLPPTAISTVGNSGRLTSTAQNAIADGVEDYFDAMTTAGHSHVIVSAVGGAWTNYPLVSLRLGDVVDTQRRRRNDLAEVYAVRTV